MDRLKFWKSKEVPEPTPEPIPTIKRFNIQPRTDVGTLGLPADPEKAARLVALRKRREALANDVAAAEEAAAAQNRWQREIAVIDQAILDIDRDLRAVGATVLPPGTALPATPITSITCETEPVARVRFCIGNATFAYVEEIDWAERGNQVVRGDLNPEQEDVDALLPERMPDDERAALRTHLQRSLFVFATDIRDRTLEGEQVPSATLADLARPSTEFGRWLDWTGRSAIQQANEAERNRLRTELARLDSERRRLIEDEAKTAERLPIARRRLAEFDRELEIFNQRP